MPASTTTYSNILIELSKAVKMHNFYPQGHPNLDSALAKCYALIKGSLAGGDVKYIINQKGFFTRDAKEVLAPGNPEVVGLAKKLFFRHINELTFTSGLRLSDIKIFLQIFRADPDELKTNGGAEIFIARHEISGVLVNELKYEDILKLKKELAERRDLEKDLLARQEQTQAEAGGGQPQPKPKEAEQKKEKEPVEELPLNALLQRIANETDAIRYQDLTVRIKERCDLLAAEKDNDGIFKALTIFHEHAEASSRLGSEIKSVADTALKYLLNANVVQYLAVRAGDKDEHKRELVQRLLLYAGQAAIEPLLNAICVSSDAAQRRIYYNTIIMFGPSIRPFVERRLDNNAWYVVRQMVSLLGELGDASSLDAMEAAYGNNTDTRIKKEVIKGLVKIKDPRSVKVLLKTLDEEDDSLVTQAVISLGIVKDPSAIEHLCRIALRWESFSESKESIKEAVKALGAIRDKKAVPCLSQIIQRRVWFGKKANDDLRVLAAYSLAMIGGDEAYDAIDRACRNSGGELYVACKRILESRNVREVSA
ncbi:MAG: HEAT repeat domain-containing protein [Deltaproteobacteria bacterium]